MEGTGSAELPKCCCLCPGFSLQRPQIPSWTETKHSRRGQRQIQHYFVPSPHSFRERNSGNESAGEGSLQVGANSFIHVLLSYPSSCTVLVRPHRGATKGPLSPRFSPSRGGCSFFLPSLSTFGMQTPAPRSPSSLQMLEPAWSRC